MRFPRFPADWAILVVLLGVLGLIQLAVAAASEPPPALSPRSTAPDGALALSLWLQRLDYGPRLTGMGNPALPHRGTLLLLSEDTDPDAAGTRAVLRWVGAGGRLVVATDGVSHAATLHQLGLFPVEAPEGTIRVAQPLRSPDIGSLWGSATTVLPDDSPGIPIAETPFGSVVLLRPWGHGEVWAVTSPDLLDNEALARQDNRLLALHLAGPRGTAVAVADPRPTPFSGGGGGGDWLTGTQWGILVLFALGVGVLYRGLTGIRLGPAVVPPGERYRPSVQYVYSLAALLQRGRRREDALRPLQRQLARRMRARYGSMESLPPDERHEVERQLAEPDNLSESDLLRRAREIVECEPEGGTE